MDVVTIWIYDHLREKSAMLRLASWLYGEIDPLWSEGLSDVPRLGRETPYADLT